MNRKQHISLISMACLVAIVAFAAAPPAAAQPAFTEVAVAAGLGNEIYHSTTAHGLGAVWIDFNDDGAPDLFVTNSFDRSPHLYQNDGDGTFTLVDELLPVLPGVEMTGAIFADYDNDGDSDIFVFTDNEVLDLHDPVNPEDGPLNILLKNLWVENGNQIIGGVPLFDEVAAAAGLDEEVDPAFGPDYDGRRTSTGGWLDYDRDGCVDLYLGHWAAAHQGELSNVDKLYRNKCDGTFEDVSITSQIQPEVDSDTYRPALTLFAGHLDQDLWPDLYIGNVIGLPPFSEDFHFKNKKTGKFDDVLSSSPGIGDDTAAAMGITVADIDLDGDFDMYLTDIKGGASAPPAGNTLYVNNGDGTFSDNSAPTAGIDADTAWPANFFDADNDGYEDLWVGTAGFTVPNFFFLNDAIPVGPATFTDMSVASGMDSLLNARGSAVADYDLDGDLDLLVVNTSNANLQLFRNDSVNANNWLKVDLQGAAGNGDAIGAIVEVDAGNLKMKRQITGISSAHSQDSLVAHFGLGAETEAAVVQVIWPSGVSHILENVAANQVVQVVEPEAPSFGFNRVTGGAGLAFKHGYAGGVQTKAERIAAGLGVGDYDNDGLLDIYMARGDVGPNLLFHNIGGGTFEEVGAAAGVDVQNEKSAGPRFVDLNGDGWQDLLLGGVEGTQPMLFENQGDGTFVDVTGASNITSPRDTFSATFADIDNDHDLDIAMAHWGFQGELCDETTPCEGHIWKNNGDGSFTESDAEAGVIYPNGEHDFTFAPNFVDIDNDDWMDLLYGSDFGTSRVYLNDGDGSFTEVTDPVVQTDENAMGGTVFDYDADGDYDWFVTSIFGGPENQAFANKTGNRLFSNIGGGNFEEVTTDSGARIGYWGWGPCFADFNNDGARDIFHVNGWIQFSFVEDLSRLFLNDGSGTFTEMSGLLGIEDTGQGRGATCFDYDRDGDIDILISNNDQQLQLYRNDGGNAEGNFLNISLKGRTANTDGIGAKIHVELDNGKNYDLQMISETSFVSQQPHEIHLGLDDATMADVVEVSWPDGIVNTYTDVAANQFVELKQTYDSVGVYLPMPGPQASRGRFKLKNLNEKASPEFVFDFGQANNGDDWYPIAGDWDGDGIDSIGAWLRPDGKFRLKNANQTGSPDLVFNFGATGNGVTPVSGDWNGDGTDTIGSYDPSARRFALRNTNNHGAADIVFSFGPSGVLGGNWIPFMGDWDGDGIDTPALYDTVTGRFLLRNSNTSGLAEIDFFFGPAGGTQYPISGDWDGDGIDTIGVWSFDTGDWYLKNSNSAGAEDIKFRFGSTEPGTRPVASMWN